MRLLVLAFATAALLGVSSGAQGSAADPAPAALCTSLQDFSDTLTELQGFEELGVALTGTQLSPTAQKALDLPRLFNSSSAFQTALATCSTLGGLETAIEDASDLDLDGDGSFSLEFQNVSVTNEESPGFIDIRFTIDAQRQYDLPIDVSAGGIDIQGGGIQATATLTTDELHFQYDTNAATPAGEAFYLIGEPKATAQVNAAGTTGAFHAQLGVLEADVNGSATLNSKIEIALDDPDDVLVGGQKHITLDEFVTGGTTSIGDLVHVNHLDGTGDDLNVRLGLNAEIAGSDLVSGADCDATAPGDQDAFVAITDANLAASPAPAVAHDFCLLSKFQNMNAEDVLGGLIQFLGGLAASQNAGDVKLPFLNTRLTEVFSATKKLSDFIKEQSEANVICGPNDTIPPTGDRKALGSLYCQAATTREVTGSSVLWTVIGGGAIDSGDETNAATVGTAPTENVHFTGITADSKIQVQFEFTDDPAAADPHKATPRFTSIQELAEKLDELELLSAAGLAYDPATAALTYDLSFTHTPAPLTKSLPFDFGDQLKEKTNLFGLSPDNGATATLTPSDVAVNLKFGALLVDDVETIEPDDNSDPDFAPNLADRFFLAVGSGDEVSLGNLDVNATVKLKGRVGFLEVGVEGKATANPDDATKAFKISKETGNPAPVLAVNVDGPGVQVGDAGGTDDLSNALLVRQLLDDPLAYVHPVCNVAMSAGLGAEATVGEGATEKTLASGSVSISWPKVFQASSCTPRTSGTDSLDIATDTEFASLKDFELIPDVTGVHGGGDDAPTLTDTDRPPSIGASKPAFPASVLNATLTNQADGSHCIVLTKTDNTLTCTLSGGRTRADGKDSNEWHTGDEYVVEGNPLVLLSLILDNLQTFAEQLEEAGLADLDQELPLVNTSPRELIQQIDNLKRTIDELRGAPSATITCGRQDADPPNPAPASDSDPSNEAAPVPDGTDIFCQAATIKPVTSAVWRITKGGTGGDNVIGLSGTHSSDAGDLLTDENAHFLAVASMLDGLTLRNVTAGTDCVLEATLITEDDRLPCPVADPITWAPGDEYEVGELGTAQLAPDARASFTVNDGDPAGDDSDLTTLDEFQIQLTYTDADGEHTADFPTLAPPQTLQDLEKLLESKLGLGAEALKIELKDLGPVVAKGTADNADPDQVLTDADAQDETGTASNFNNSNVEPGFTLRRLGDDSTCTIDQVTETTLRCQTSDAITWTSGDTYQVLGDGTKDLILRLGYGFCTDDNANATTNENSVVGSCVASDKLIPKPKAPFKLELPDSVVSSDLFGLETDGSFELEFAARAQLDVALSLNLVPQTKVLNTTRIELKGGVSSPALNLMANVGPLKLIIGGGPDGVIVTTGSHSEANTDPLATVLTDSANDFLVANVPVGAKLINTTTSQQCVVSAVAQHTLTCGTGIEWHENDEYEVRTVSSAKMGASFDLKHPAITDSNGNNVPFANTGAVFTNIVSGYLSGLDPNFDGIPVNCQGAQVDFEDTPDGGLEDVAGDACARLPLALEVSGSDPEYLGDLAFKLADLTSPSPEFYVPPDLLDRIANAVLDWDVLLRALAEQLREIEGTLNGAAQDIEFPLIGGALDGGAAVAHKLSEFVDQLANLAQQIEDATDADGDTDSGDPFDLAKVIRDQIDAKAGDLLRDLNGDGSKDADDVVVTFLCGSTVCADEADLFNIDDVRITFEIGQGTETCGDGGTCEAGVDIPFDIGLKGLPLRAAGALHTEAGWKLKIDFGLSRDKGPYLVSHGPAGFEETGGHDGAADAPILTDNDRDFTGADKVEIGSQLINVTDDADERCYITAVTQHTLSCDNPNTTGATEVEGFDWDVDDDYKVIARHGPDSTTAGTGDPELKVGASIALADAPADVCAGDPFNAGDPSSGGDPGPLDSPNFDDNRCLTAEVGFLQVTARDGDDSGSSDTDHSPSKAEIHASADFKSTEAKVGIGDLGTVDLDFDIGASANVDLRLRTGFRGQDAGFPSVVGAFHFRFDTGSPVDTSTDETTDAGWIEELRFDNLYLDAGSFLSQYLQPIAKEIKRLTGPLQPVIQTLRSPIPVVSDIAEAVGLDPITFIDLMEAATGADLSLVESVMAFIDFARRIGGTNQSLLIPLGGGGLAGAFDVNPTKAIGPAQTPDQADSLIANPVGGTGLLSAIDGDDHPVPGDRPGTFGVPGLTFPFMEDAGQIFGVLMGKDATLVRYDAGPLEACAGFGISLPPFFIGPVPVTVGFGGSACVSGRFVVGYDTSGLRKVLSGASGLYLFDGIFFDDLDENGQDVPEIVFTGEVFVSAGVSIYIFTAGLEGGIRLSTMLDLDDSPNADGKLHIEEIFNKLHNPICLFIVSGKIEAFLRAFLKIDLFLYTKTFRFELVKITLLDFSLGCDPPNPNLADVVDGNLVLNMGDRADLRGIQTDVVDETFIVRQLDTSGGNTTFSIDAFGIHEEETIPNSGKIIANGTDGDDSVTLLPGASSAPTENGVPTASIPFSFPAVISGGDGADEIGTGGGNDKVWGDNEDGSGSGDDRITTGAGVDEARGGPGADSIDVGLGNDSGTGKGAFGEAGDDKLNGGAGADFLAGGPDSDSLEGGPGLDPASTDGIAHPELTDGGDELRGGPGDDGLTGAFGADVMYGDEVLGNAGTPSCGSDGSTDTSIGNGRDSLIGGLGNDKMWGGNNQDRLEGEEGDDFLCGGGGNDSGDGGVLGQAGNDEGHGGGGHDFVDGSDGHDNLFGDAGNDTVIGGAGHDDARGGNGKDVVRGNTGNDVLLGDAGGIESHSEANHDGNPASITVTPGNAAAFGTAVNCNAPGIFDGNADCIFGGDGADLVFGEGGNDQIFGDDSSSASAGSDYMEGNAGADTMRGGFLADLMHGNDGGDSMYGDSGMDRMLGGANNDTMYGGIDADYMEGNENDSAPGDTMFGDDGTDRMVGGSTGDTVHGKSSNGDTEDGGDEMHGGSANDVMTGDNATIGDISGTPVGAESFHNEETIGGADTMFGDVGDDRMFGEFAGDTMRGGQMDDYMEGNGGSDSMYGEENQDDMIGGGDAAGVDDAGETLMSGGADIDYMTGDNAQITRNSPRNVVLLDLNSTEGDFAGDDVMQGDAAEDVMYGQGEHDTMDGGAADDYMEGNTGKDSMQGGPGADDMLGGSGHDNGEADGFRELDFVDDESVAGLGDQMWGGNNPAAGGDGVDFMAGDNANITRPSVGVRLIALYNVDFADITPDPDPILSGNDTMHGNAANDLMYGQGDNDTMFGDEDADYMEGNTGRDIMEGNADDDDMVGGSGRDNGGEAGALRRLENAVDENVPGIALAGETDGDQMFGNATLDGNAAADADDYMAGDNAFITRNSPRSIELYDVPFADGPAIDGAVSGDDFMHGNGDADVMYGQGDLDQMFGDAGDDYMEGNSHDDYMEGNGDEDDMLGGSGHDNADDDVEPDDFRELRNVLDGRDTMFGNDGVDYMGGDNANILRAGGIKNFDGPSAGRSVELYDVQLADGPAIPAGVSAGDTMEGNAGNDVIFGQGNGSQPASQADPDDDIDNDRDGREDGDPSDGADRGYDCNDGAADTTVFLANPDNDGNGDVDAADPQCQAATDEDADWQGDFIHGNEGHDYIEGNHGSDWMFGDGGEDDMAGGGSADDGKVYDSDGDPIADRTAAGLLDGHDVMWGNEEDDSVVGDNGAHTRPTTEAGAWKKDSGGNGFDQFERTMTMSQSPEPGAAHGNDYLRGNEGNDDMFGQLGDDYMQGDAAEDVMLGDLGQVENEVIGGTGAGTFIDINPPFIEEFIDVPGTLKRVVTLYAHNTDLAGAGGGADTMLGNEGNDKMHGGPGPDLMQGNGDTPNPANASTPPGDFLFGGDGDDALWGGRGHDHLFGGWGDDFHDVAPRPYMDLNGDTVSDVPQDLPVWFELAGAEHNQGLDFTWGGRDKDAHQASFGRPGPRPGDRLIDAVGNTNIFYTCPGAYGEGVINRDELMPDMRLFLQELAAGDGAVDTLDPASSGGRELSILFPGDESGNPPYPGSPGHFTCPPSDPGFAAAAVTLSSEQITAGDQVTITAAVGNDAPAATGAVVVRFAVNGVEIGRQTVEGIEEGGTDTASQVWNTRNLHGPQRIDVTIDPDNAITGENEENNAASLDASVTGTDAAIAPADVALSRTKIVAGDKVDVSATVRNPSSAPAYDVVVKFTDNGAEIGSRTIAQIAAGGSATATVRWRTNKLSGEHTVAATADPANAIAEVDESNNAAGVVANVIANKVKNGVFEPSTVTPTAPDAWTESGATTYTELEGDWFVGAGSSSFWMTDEMIDVTPGATYELGTDATGGVGVIAVKQYTLAGKGLKTLSFVLQPPADDKLVFEQTFVADGRAERVRVLLYGGLNGIPTDFTNTQLSDAVP